MARIKLSARITDLSDRQLWAALRVPAGTAIPSETQHLREAIRLGKAGQTEVALTRLAEHHRRSLAEEWRRIEQQAQAAPAPNPQAIENLHQHKITCWHHQTIQFGEQIDWYPTRLLASDSLAGFHYFGWFAPLVTAYIQTGEPRHGELIRDLIEQYYFNTRAHPAWNAPARGQHDLKWAVFNQLGIGGRLPHWLRAYLALNHHGMLRPRTIEAFVKSFLGYGRAIEPQNPTFVAHNIPTHGCRALLQIARLFPEFRESPGWDRFASMRLYEQVTKGFYEDGCHQERVWGYGSHTLRSLSEVYDLAQHYGGLGEYEKPFLKGLRRAYQFYAQSAGPRPGLHMPTYGDAGERSSAAGILEVGRKYFPPGTDESLGVDRTRSYLFKPSGFAVLRNGDDERSTYVNLSFGKFAGWHSHQDLLSMNLWAFGEPLLEELCRFGPYGNPLDVLFRAPEAHNLLTIDGMVYDSRNVVGEDVAWHSDGAVDYFSATHWAYHFYVYGKDSGPVSPNIEAKVWRTVVFVKDPGYVLVLDSVTDRNHPERFNRAITQRWHGPRPFRPTGPTSARTQGSPGCVLAWAHPEGLVRLESGCDFSEEEGSVFGKAYSRYFLNARRWMPLDHTGIVGFATLLAPFKGKAPDPSEVSLRALASEPARMWRAEAYEVTTAAGRDVIVLNPEQRDDLPWNGSPMTGRLRIERGDGQVIEVA